MQYFRNAGEICLMLIALAIFCLFFSYAWPEGRYGMAAWVQAIGSIAALGTAVYIMRAQGKESARLVAAAETRALVRQAHAVKVIVDKLGEELKNFSGKLQDKHNAAAKLEVMRDVNPFSESLMLVRAIPFHALGSQQMVSGLFEMQKAARTLDELLEKARELHAQGVSSSNWNGHEIVARVAFATLAYEVARNVFDQGVGKLERGE